MVSSPEYAQATAEVRAREAERRPAHAGVHAVMKSIRSWFTPEVRASGSDYTSALLAQSLLTAKGINSLKSNAAYRGSLTLIGHSAGVATLTGLHADALQGHLVYYRAFDGGHRSKRLAHSSRSRWRGRVVACHSGGGSRRS